jgi:tetratricopeptide (TPR) repeat protein
VARAITCAACGAKFRADRARCPRCRTVIARPDLVAEAASSRKLLRVAAAIGAVFIAGIAFLWVTRDTEPDVPAQASRPAAPVSRPKPPAPGAANGANAVPAPPFLDPSGAATLAYHAQDYQTALAQFQAAVDRNPNDAEALSNLGQVLVKLGRTADAVPHFVKSTTLNPGRWAYRFNLARALGLLGRWDEAIASYQQAQRLFPNDYITAFNLALALHKSGDEASAVVQYRRAIELHPDDPSFRVALGTSYERLQKPADAVAAYSEYLRLMPSGPDADKVRVRIAQLQGSITPPPSGPTAGGQTP